MVQASKCQTCSAVLAEEYRSLEVTVEYCRVCGHRQAVHHVPHRASDYYESAPSRPRFVASLRATRERQARDILRRIAKVGEGDRPWLDFGSGRGWFLQEAKAAGRRQLAGFDASEIALGWLAREGIIAARPRAGEFWPDWRTLPESPEVVSLLDVIEHFESPRAVLERILTELPSLRRIVLKVPMADGALFRLAKIMRSRAPSIYEQLFQVGTFPPHYHYFSRASMRTFLSDFPLEVEAEWGDSEVDNLFWRIASLENLPGGRAAGAALALLPADSAVWILKVRR